ncbi:MAG: hypothetical protein ACKO5F_02020 [Synechococcus sp.]
MFHAINAHATEQRPALITIPGIGCGQFAGPFRGTLAPLLQDVLHRLLLDHGQEWPNIRAVHFDPYSHGENHREMIHGIRFQVRPSNAAGNQPIPQLCPPSTYAAAGDNFSNCGLYSLVAWDHVSWPGNDFYGNARATDDGVKAAATDAMARVTGVLGRYDAHLAYYRPPAPFRSWNEVALDRVENQGFRLWDLALVRLDAAPDSLARLTSQAATRRQRHDP